MLSPGRARLFLLISLFILAAVPRLYVAANQPLNYDEHWHVFVAQQDTPKGFADEWRNNAHPPLFYWLLRLPTSLARNRLLDRSISLLAGVVAVFLLGHIVARITSNPPVSYLAALAFALSPSAVLISSEARSYMLSTFFILLAFAQYLSLVQGHYSIRTAIAFSASSCLALMSHYFAVFFLFACLGALLYTGAGRTLRRGNIWCFFRERWVILATAVLPILLTAAWLYRTHVRYWLRPQNHTDAFYFHPESGERLLGYLVGAAYNSFNLFSPVSLGEDAAIPVSLLLLTFVGVSLVYLSRLRARARALSRCLPLLFLLLLAGGLLTASVMGAYPFGGDLRHQFILFPFVLITAFVLMDSALSRLRSLAIPVIGLALFGISLNSAVHLSHVYESREDRFGTMFAKEIALYRQAFPEPTAVYLDQFSLVVFFAHSEPRQWRSLDFATYEARSNGRPIVILRDLARWKVDLLDEGLYKDVAAHLKSSAFQSTTLFCLRCTFASASWDPGEEHAFRRQVSALAARHHLKVPHLVLDGSNVFGQFSF